MNCPDATRWVATQDRQPPTPHTLHVDGDPCMPSGHHVPRLTRAVPQGTNPRILVLDLEAVDTGKPGHAAFTRVEAKYQERSNEEYDQIQIRSSTSGEPDATIDVTVLHRR
jgi:hypothetical protein